MEKTMQRTLLAGAAAAGMALLGGAVYLWRENQTEEPDFRALLTEGDFQIRRTNGRNERNGRKRRDQ